MAGLTEVALPLLEDPPPPVISWALSLAMKSMSVDAVEPTEVTLEEE